MLWNSQKFYARSVAVQLKTCEISLFCFQILTITITSWLEIFNFGGHLAVKLTNNYTLFPIYSRLLNFDKTNFSKTKLLPWYGKPNICNSFWHFTEEEKELTYIFFCDVCRAVIEKLWLWFLVPALRRSTADTFQTDTDEAFTGTKLTNTTFFKQILTTETNGLSHTLRTFFAQSQPTSTLLQLSGLAGMD